MDDDSPGAVQYDEYGFPLETDPDLVLLRLKQKGEEMDAMRRAAHFVRQP